MYKRQVTLGLIMMLVVTVVAAIIANIDPFHTNEVWLNWIVLTTTCVIAAMAATSLATYMLEKPDKEYFEAFGGWVLCLLFSGVMILGLVTEGVKKPFNSLVWGGFAAFFVTYVVTGMLAYLVKKDPAAAARKSLRRVA